MILFSEETINFMKSNSLKYIKGTVLSKLFSKYIKKNKFRNLNIYESIINDQFNVLQNLGNVFYIKDLEFIKSFMNLSETISCNYDSFDNYFIDKKTNSIYLKVKKTVEEDTHFSKKSYEESAHKNLISINDFLSSNSSLVEKFPLKNQNLKKFSSNFSFISNKINSINSCDVKKCSKIHKKVFKNIKKTKGIKKRIYKKESCKGCKCSKSKCLRLHCICFRSGNFCGDSCNCKGCFNNLENKDLVKEVVNVTKDINSQAFKSRVLEIELEQGTIKLTSGCSCSKNNCLKNYCECRKNGLGCSPLCKCENCKNDKIELDPILANKLYSKASRKKKKIIFKTTTKDQIEMTEQILSNRFRK